MNEQLSFKAEIKEVSSKKTASLDVTYKVVLLTQDPKVLLLGSLPGDELVDVEVK